MPAPEAAGHTIFDPFDDDDGWEEMPVVRDDFANGLDDEDRRKYHYVTPEKQGAVNATGNLIDFDDEGQEWREKLDATNESEYTRLRLTEEDENDEVALRTKFLFDEDKAMTPLSQMQATKDMLTEAQRIAYVGLCALIIREMSVAFKAAKRRELKPALESSDLWALKIMGRLYYHMELETQEQKMIESLADHGVQAADLVPSLVTTRTVANPEYDPAEASKHAIAKREAEEERLRAEEDAATDITDDSTLSVEPPEAEPATPKTSTRPAQTTANVLPPSAEPLAGVSTSLSSVDKDVTLDIRWTVLCDLFLILIADSVYDARSRVLLEATAFKLGLGWMDVVRFEQRVTEALEIQEGVERLEAKDVIEGRMKAAKRRRYAMLGLATLGGGLVIGLSAGLLAPVIGAGLGAAFTTIGVSGTSAFLAGTGGAAVITTAGTLTGSGIAARGMARRTRDVRTFDLLPLHNNKRVNCILTVSGFMTSPKDDVRLPFSVLDPVVGDVFSVLWEPEMLGETGGALKILTGEVLSQVGQTVLQATVMTALMSALQWPILLTKLGYLIDNPWSNALDRARAAGAVLADVLIRRYLGVRPITLIGFSLGARVIFYCLLELAKQKAFGIVQDVFILGATLTATRESWLQARSVVSGRFVNGFARNDWVLNYLFRATSGGLQNIAGLRAVLDVPGLENVDVTDKIAGHMSYRTFMPLILDQLGFPVSAKYFDEPVEPDMKGDREVVREGEQASKKTWFSRKSKASTGSVSRPPTAVSSGGSGKKPSPLSSVEKADDDELPERLSTPSGSVTSPMQSPPTTPSVNSRGAEQDMGPEDSQDAVPLHAGFDFKAIQEVIASSGGAGSADADVLHAPIPQRRLATPPIHQSLGRTESAPPPVPPKANTPKLTSTSQTTLHNRVRVVSAPVFGEEEEGDITAELAPGPSSGPRRDLSSAFSKAVSLADQSNAFAPTAGRSAFDSIDADKGVTRGNTRITESLPYMSQLSMPPIASVTSQASDHSERIGGSERIRDEEEEEEEESPVERSTGSSAGLAVGNYSPYGAYNSITSSLPYGSYASNAMTSNALSSARSRTDAGALGLGLGPADSTATLSFAGGSGNIWGTGPRETSAGTSTFSRGSDAGGLSLSSTSTSSPFSTSITSAAPPSLPQDILNPFAVSSVDLAFGAQDGSVTSEAASGTGTGPGDYWSPPPLLSATRAGQGKKKQTVATSSTTALNSNPWS